MDMKDMSRTIRSFFIDIADKTAKTTKFVRRKSKLSGSLFLQILVLGFLRNPKSSLNDLSEFSEDHSALDITPQGIDGRINKYSLSFVKKMFDIALDMFRQTVPIPIPIMEQFSAVNITDSTGITLPETLSDEFPGSGGSASGAALKLQLIFDFLSGCFKAVTLTNGITPDQRYKKHIGKAEPGSLNLSDLGYFSISHLRDFADKGAYFLCRLLPRTGLSANDGTKVNLPDLPETKYGTVLSRNFVLEKSYQDAEHAFPKFLTKQPNSDVGMPERRQPKKGVLRKRNRSN